ncbi:enoyl-CoA hydratase/isomerase family protein [Mucilaginibacter sp. RCC_168]|uniref:enoyl-CoA hydratase/isomerase family protein n=1 Tax=Mucilaginibacter sp. RCC_168 TaxID=3239221 RepID=UPI003526A77B
MENVALSPTPLLVNDLESLRQWQNSELNRLKKLPLPTKRDVEQEKSARFYFDALAELRARLIALHGNEIYAAVTNNFSELVRIEDLLYRIAKKFPGLAPTRSEIIQDESYFLCNKEGHELSQGLILSELLAIPHIGQHLMTAMQQPKEKSFSLLAQFQQQHHLRLETVTVIKKNNVAYLYLSNQSFLNAEDDQLNSDMEFAVDVILLDPNVDVAVIRGDVMSHKKYNGKRVFCSGVNLTKLYRGQLSYLFYVTRELGLITKIYRGLMHGENNVNKIPNCVIEKPWISVVDSHAIGGGFQMLLVSDYVIAESGALLSVPARREGFIPGLTNLRLPRFVGQRLSNQLVYNNYQIIVDSDEGKLIVDEVVDANCINDSLKSVIDSMTEFGIGGFISNRKAFRLGVEPISLFLQYMATFCREQVKCMYGPDIVNNLERFWVMRK